MTDQREYPEETAGPFPTPPVSFEDREGRSIEVRRYDPSRDRDPLTAMYAAFDPADRAQGIPPTSEKRIASWLDTITGSGTVNVVARHEDNGSTGNRTESGDDVEHGSTGSRETPDGIVVGHATLVPDDPPGTAELAIFVLQAYQGAGIGTRLIETLLGAGHEAGIDRVWLTVERWNDSAINLYEKVGFRRSSDDSFEHEMALRLRA